MPGNAEAWTLWDFVSTQWRAGGFGVIGLDYGAVRRMARDLGIAWSIGMIRKMRALERTCLERASEKETKDPHAT